MNATTKSPARRQPRRASKKEQPATRSLPAAEPADTSGRLLEVAAEGEKRFLERLRAGRLDLHPACMLFPAMRDADLDELVEDIRRTRRVTDEIVFEADGSVVDGRNRAMALIRLAREGEPVGNVNMLFDESTESWKEVGKDYVHASRPMIRWAASFAGRVLPEALGDAAALTAWVVSKNLARRHLSESQRAAIAAELANLTARDAAARRGTARVDTDIEAPSKTSVSEAAARLHVSTATVQNAKRVKKEAPAAFEKIKAGKSTVGAEVKKLPTTKATSAPKRLRTPAQLGAFAQISESPPAAMKRTPSVVSILEMAELLEAAEIRELIGGLEALLEDQGAPR